MALSISNAEFLMLTMQKSDCQYQMMEIMHQMQQLAMETSRASEKQAKVMNMYLQRMDESPELASEIDFQEAFLNLDEDAAQIQMKDKLLNSKKLNIETKLKAIEAREESVKKQKEANLKNICISNGS